MRRIPIVNAPAQPRERLSRPPADVFGEAGDDLLGRDRLGCFYSPALVAFAVDEQQTQGRGTERGQERLKRATEHHPRGQCRVEVARRPIVSAGQHGMDGPTRCKSGGSVLKGGRPLDGEGVAEGGEARAEPAVGAGSGQVNGVRVQRHQPRPRQRQGVDADQRVGSAEREKQGGCVGRDTLKFGIAAKPFGLDTTEHQLFQSALQVGVVGFARQALCGANVGPQAAPGFVDESGGAAGAQAVFQPPGDPRDGAQYFGLVRRETAPGALGRGGPKPASREGSHSRSSTASRMAEKPAVPPMSWEWTPAWIASIQAARSFAAAAS